MKQWETLFRQAREALELLPVGICVSRTDGTVVYQNALFSTMVSDPVEIARLSYEAVSSHPKTKEYPIGPRTIRVTGSIMAAADAGDESGVLMVAQDVTAEKALVMTLNAATGCLQLVQNELASVVEHACPFTVNNPLANPLTKYLGCGQPRVLLIGPKPFNHLAISCIYTAGFALYRAHDVPSAMSMVPAFKPTLAIVERDADLAHIPDLVRNIRRIVPEAAIVGVGTFEDHVALMFNECLPTEEQDKEILRRVD